MKQQFVADLSPGASATTTFLVQDKEQRFSRAGEAYLDLELRDATGVVRGRVRDRNALRVDFEKDDVVPVEGEVEEFQGTLQIRVRHAAPFSRSTRHPVTQ